MLIKKLIKKDVSSLYSQMFCYKIEKMYSNNFKRDANRRLFDSSYSINKSILLMSISVLLGQDTSDSIN